MPFRDFYARLACGDLEGSDEHAAVGANSIVTKPVPPFSVAAAVPARVIDYFGPDEQMPDGYRGGAAGSGKP